MISALRRLAVAALLGVAGAHTLTAQSVLAQSAPSSAPVTVLELFTSQGCSSCPAADALFKAYTERPDVLALSFSVDYWDYLGWKDTLASPKFTERQRGYGKAISNGQIYTPQMVVNGARHAVGSSRADIDAAVIAAISSSAAQAFRIDASRVDGGIALQAAVLPATPLLQPATGVIWLLTVRSRETVAVKRGENSGHTLTYFNSVRDVAQVGEWTGQSTTIRLPAGASPLGPDERYAVLIQRTSQGPLLGAGWVK
jgi:hypothetical protein